MISAFDGKADMPFRPSHFRFWDPNRALNLISF
jgi:hypothetical protein